MANNDKMSEKHITSLLHAFLERKGNVLTADKLLAYNSPHYRMGQFSFDPHYGPICPGLFLLLNIGKPMLLAKEGPVC